MADILIRGMEMPTNVFDCPLNSFGICNLGTHCDCIEDSRPEWCPLLPLSEGHGRLIDAEAYVDYMQNRYDNNEITNGDWIDFRLSLKDQPTIVPAEGGD